MTVPNKELMAQARGRLANKWGVMGLTLLIYMLIAIGIQFLPTAALIVVSFAVSGPLQIGLLSLCLSVSRGGDAEIDRIFQWFKNGNSYWRAFWLTILLQVYILLWMLLLIVPGFIAIYSYTLAPYILNDNPDMTPNQAIARSKKLMYGHRWRLACLQGRFIGWWLLCILTVGIGSLWLVPYYQVSVSRFYDDLLANGTEPQVIV